MAIIVAFAAFILIFFMVRHHVGPAHLAMLAGVSVFSMFGAQFIDLLQANILPGVDAELLRQCVYLLFVLAFPLLLYFRSSAGGLSGLLRVVEAVVFAATMTILISGPLSFFFSFDPSSVELYNTLKLYEGTVSLVAVIIAYLDLIFYRE